MKLKVINAGHFKLDGGAMFGVVPKSLWNKLNPADENNMCSWAMRCLAIEEGNKLLLIDNGMGQKQDEKFFSFYYLHGNDSLKGSLQKAGYGFDEVSHAFLTHLHFDHCGGAVEWNNDRTKYKTSFKNAQYLTNEAHWNWAVKPNAREKASFLKENILPIEEAGQLSFISGGQVNGFESIVEIIQVYGHTEAMMLPLISYKGRKILYCADLIPSLGHLPLPYVMAYDMRPLETLTEKEQLLKRAVAEDWVLFFEHDPKIECCSLIETEKGIRASHTFALDEL